MSGPYSVDICVECDVVIEEHTIVIDGDLTCPYCGNIIRKDIE